MKKSIKHKVKSAKGSVGEMNLNDQAPSTSGQLKKSKSTVVKTLKTKTKTGRDIEVEDEFWDSKTQRPKGLPPPVEITLDTFRSDREVKLSGTDHRIITIRQHEEKVTSPVGFGERRRFEEDDYDIPYFGLSPMSSPYLSPFSSPSPSPYPSPFSSPSPSPSPPRTPLIEKPAVLAATSHLSDGTTLKKICGTSRDREVIVFLKPNPKAKPGLTTSESAKRCPKTICPGSSASGSSATESFELSSESPSVKFEQGVDAFKKLNEKGLGNPKDMEAFFAQQKLILEQRFQNVRNKAWHSLFAKDQTKPPPKTVDVVERVYHSGMILRSYTKEESVEEWNPSANLNVNSSETSDTTKSSQGPSCSSKPTTAAGHLTKKARKSIRQSQV